MGKRQVVGGKKGKGTLATDHITKPAVPEMIQTKLIHVGMKVYVPDSSFLELSVVLLSVVLL